LRLEDVGHAVNLRVGADDYRDIALLLNRLTAGVLAAARLRSHHVVMSSS
jgi:hypothetical protein